MGRTTTKFNCKGVCTKYHTTGRYNKPENAFCACCSIFIKWEGIHCPCCMARLRRRPRSTSKNSTVKYRERKKVVYQ